MKPVPVTEAAFGFLDANSYSMERKFDGWRALPIVGRDGTSLWTRERRRIEMPDGLGKALKELGLPPGTVLDGEIWNPVKRGGWKHAKGVECRLTLWDVIVNGGKDMSLEPIEARRAALRELIPADGDLIQIAEVLPFTVEEVRKVHEEARAVREGPGLRSGFIHGVVIKKNASPRRDHATRSVEHADWLKLVFPGMSGWAPK